MWMSFRSALRKPVRSRRMPRKIANRYQESLGGVIGDVVTGIDWELSATARMPS